MPFPPYMQPLRGTTGGRWNRTGTLISAVDYPNADVTAALRTHRVQVFRYELHRIITGVWTVVADATPLVKSCTIKRDAHGEHFQGSAAIELEDDARIVNFLTDAIRCFWLLLMPDGNYVQWMMGTFYVPSPKIPMKFGPVRTVETQDSIRNLYDSKITDWFQVPSPPPGGGFADGDAVEWARKLITDRYPLAGIDMPTSTVRVQDQPPPAPAQYRSKIYEVGTSVIDVVNNLIWFAGYDHMWANPSGSYVAYPRVLPSARPVEWTYVADGSSIIVRESGESEQDLWNAPNQFLRVVTRPAAPLLRSRRTITDPANPLSTTYRGRTVVDYAPSLAPDQASLDSEVQFAYEAGQHILKKLRLQVPLMPHWGQEKVIVQWTAAHPWYQDGNGVYIVYGWTFPCTPDGVMQLELELSPNSPAIPAAAAEGYTTVSTNPAAPMGLSIGAASYGFGTEAAVVTATVAAANAGAGSETVTATGSVAAADSGAGTEAGVKTP